MSNKIESYHSNPNEVLPQKKFDSEEERRTYELSCIQQVNDKIAELSLQNLSRGPLFDEFCFLRAAKLKLMPKNVIAHFEEEDMHNRLWDPKYIQKLEERFMALMERHDPLKQTSQILRPESVKSQL